MTSLRLSRISTPRMNWRQEESHPHEIRSPLAGFLCLGQWHRQNHPSHQPDPVLVLHGLRLSVIKHAHHTFDIDHPGKDSHRLTQAGADVMLISSPEKLALVKKHDAAAPVEELIAAYLGGMDVVLTEGFKKSGLPKIEVHRAGRSATLLCRGEEYDPALLAVASDARLQLDVPLLDLDNPAQVADFVVQALGLKPVV